MRIVPITLIGPSRAWIVRRTVAVVVTGGLAAAGCGSQSGPGDAARRFVSAVAASDRARWCPEMSGSVLGARPGPLSGHQLAFCVHNDIFLAIGACEQETAVADGSVRGVDSAGASARVRLSDAAVLSLRRVNGRWLVADVDASRVDPRKLGRPRCGSKTGPPASGTQTI